MTLENKRSTASADEQVPRSSEAARDLQAREAARHDGRALLAYERDWHRRLARLQRRYPERWCVLGLSDEEVRDLLTLRLIEAVRVPSAADLALEELCARTGRTWALLVLRRACRALRGSFRLQVVVGELDLGDARPWRHLPTQEELCLEAEAHGTRRRTQARAESALSRPLRSWWSAFRASAEAGAFFEASGRPNLSAAARAAGRDRSSALRAFQQLKLHFARARGRAS